MRRPGRAKTLLLLSILAVGLLLRLAGIGQGLPYVVGPDEGFEIHRALKLGLGEIDLDRVSKGGFFYLLFVEYGFYYVWLRLTGEVTSPQEFSLRFAEDLSPFWMIARVTHVLVGVLVILCSPPSQPGGATTTRISRPYFFANTKSRASWAGTPMTAPVP